MGDVLYFGSMQFERVRRRHALERTAATCQHKRLTLDENGDVCSCRDCGVQVSAFWALMRFVEEWTDHARKTATAAERIRADAEATLHLRAARRWESAWRSRTMLPACPHCGRGILPNDPGGQVNREIELRRRETEEATVRAALAIAGAADPTGASSND